MLWALFHSNSDLSGTKETPETGVDTHEFEFLKSRIFIILNIENTEFNFSGNFEPEFDIDMTELDLVSNHLT